MSNVIPYYRTIRELLQNKTFAIDEYQREYKWETKHITELLADLYNKFDSSYNKGDETSVVGGYSEYFLGSIIVSNRANINYLIDGQQRVTSLTLLLIYLYRETKTLELDIFSMISSLIYSDNFGNRTFNLAIGERLPVINALFNGEPFNVEDKDESIQAMYFRYQDIVNYDLANELGEALPHFVYWLLNRVGLIEIVTTNDSYAYTIFETMNDRGKPLSPVDMLKAFLLARVEEADKRAELNQLWKKEVLSLIAWNEQPDQERDAACIKAWFRAQYADSVRERKAGAEDRDWELIGNAFHRWARDNANALGLNEARQNIQFIENYFPFFSKAYRMVLDASDQLTEGLEAVFYNAHNNFTWQNTVLLAPLCVSDDNATIKKKLAITATYLDIWLMRRVSNSFSVSYSFVNYTMYLLCNEIRQKSVEELAQILTAKLDADDVTFSGAAKKNRQGINNLRLNQFSRRYIYHMLSRLTAYIEVQSGKPNLFADYINRDTANSFDIEHIWQDDFSVFADIYHDNESFQWDRNHIAGLLLLPADVNRSLQAKDYPDKVKHYAKQNLLAASLCEVTYQHQPQFNQFIARSNLPFKPYSLFTLSEQLERRELIKQLVEQVWSVNTIKELL